MTNSLTADVLVIGSGVNGAATAFFLAERGVGRILVLDRDYPGAGASSRGQGVLRVYHRNEPEVVLAHTSLGVFADWAHVVGGTCGYEATGYLWLDHAAQAAQLRGDVAMLRRLGSRSELIDEAELRRLQPMMTAADTVAISEPECGSASALLATESLLDGARRRGAELRTRTPVVALTAQAGRVTGAMTAAGPVSAGCVVLAAGAWTAPLARTIGISLPIEPRRLSMGRFLLPDAAGRPMTFLDAMFDTAFRPDTGNSALISTRDAGYGKPTDPDHLPDLVDAATIENAVARISRRIPAAAQAVATNVWAGVDGFTPDYKGIYGRLDDMEGLYICAGSSEKGFKVAPAVGMGMAELIATGRSALIDDPAFSASRFRRAASTAEAGKQFSVEELL